MELTFLQQSRYCMLYKLKTSDIFQGQLCIKDTEQKQKETNI